MGCARVRVGEQISINSLRVIESIYPSTFKMDELINIFLEVLIQQVWRVGLGYNDELAKLKHHLSVP